MSERYGKKNYEFNFKNTKSVGFKRGKLRYYESAKIFEPFKTRPLSILNITVEDNSSLFR